MNSTMHEYLMELRYGAIDPTATDEPAGYRLEKFYGEILGDNEADSEDHGNEC